KKQRLKKLHAKRRRPRKQRLKRKPLKKKLREKRRPLKKRQPKRPLQRRPLLKRKRRLKKRPPRKRLLKQKQQRRRRLQKKRPRPSANANYARPSSLPRARRQGCAAAPPHAVRQAAATMPAGVQQFVRVSSPALPTRGVVIQVATILTPFTAYS